MKKGILIRLLGMAAMFSMLVAALPLSAVLAAGIVVTPDEVEVGDTIDVTGTAFGSDKIVFIIIAASDSEIVTGDDIDIDVTTWKLIGTTSTIGITGSIETTVTIPSVINDGADDITIDHGGTYYILATLDGIPNILAVVPITITGFGEIDIDEDTGFVGLDVEITGAGFSDSEDITVTWDGDDITNDISGDDNTNNDGEFEFSFEIPEDITGDHEITVEDETGNTATVTFTIEPQIILDVDSGPPGTVVTVNGTGFDKNEDFDSVQFNNVDILGDIIGDDDAGSDGSFDFTFIVPATLASGLYTLEVEGDEGSNEEAEFTVAITADIDKTSGAVGETLTITGTGFTSGTAITVSYDGSPLTLSVSAIDVSGNLTVQFDAPVSTSGAHLITLTVGTFTDSYTFTMESEAPGAPTLSLPLAGEKADQPITFDWSDVTDDSGVTYELWVANNAEFTTPILKKTGLTDSSYTMTEAEKLESVSSDTPYYWSVRAIDNAGNVGVWPTATPTLTVGFTFSMSGWVWWVLGGIGVLFVVFFVFYMGRRSITY
jgi:hypothetical protein